MLKQVDDRHALLQSIPAKAAAYCQQLMEDQSVAILLSKRRNSKWGDYRFGPSVQPRITVNRDLEAPLLLLTFLHEFAHHRTTQRHGRKVQPHGKEWKACFIELMLPVLNQAVFPDPLFSIIAEHMRSPRANISSDQALYAYVHRHQPTNQLTVADLSNGTHFTFRQHQYQVIGRLRKRVKCLRIKDRRIYLFQPLTPIAGGQGH